MCTFALRLTIAIFFARLRDARVLYCDGHVEAISYDIDPQVYRYNGNCKDGNIIAQ